MRLKRALAFACGAVLLGTAVPAAPAFAGTLQINPVLLEINASRRTALVTLRNEEAEPVMVRAYPLEWRQANGEDVYSETTAVIVSPPIFTIPAGGTQLIRVGLRSPAVAPGSYRLIVEEVPDAQPTGGIRVALRLNLPFYSTMPAGDAAALRWAIWQEPGGGWTLEAVNTGTGYVRLDRAAARNATGLTLGENINLGTVLPGATRRWPIGAELHILDRARFQQIARTHGRDAAQASRN